MLYYWTVFGTPGKGRWGLSVEGHHLSLNFVVEGERIVASTPQFMGANPAEIRTAAEGFSSAIRPLNACAAIHSMITEEMQVPVLMAWQRG